MASKILIIEDDVFLGDVLVQKLSTAGYDVALSRDGAEGLAKLKELRPDLLLLDIILPTMNGYEILDHKYNDPTVRNIPTIIISNSGQPVEINRALALGVKDYLVKAQFDPEDVLKKVREQFNHEQKSEGPKDQSLKDRMILWVEDDKFLSDLISRKLSSQGALLSHADNGEEALKHVEKELPDIVLLDILLSGMDGFEILKRLKEDPKTKNIPVILLSNLGQQDDIDKGKKLGAARFLVKATVTLDEIVEEIKTVISK